MSRAEDQTRVLLDALTRPCPSTGCPLGADHPGPCAYPSELANELSKDNTCSARGDEPHAPDCPDPITFTPPCTCDATGEQPHAEDCPRAKRMYPFGGLPWDPAEHDANRPRTAVELAMEKIRNPRPGSLTPFDVIEQPTRINDDGVVVPDLRSPKAVAIGSNPFVQKREALQREMVSSKYTMRRRGRMIPERGRMVVARVEWDEKIGSIFILDGHKKQLEQSNQEAVIMACGPLRIDPATGKEVPMRFSIQEAIGKHIVIREHSGIEFVTHDENGKEIICYWIGQSEVWGWLEPYPGDEANSPEIWKAIAYLGEESTPKSDTCNISCSICEDGCAFSSTSNHEHLCIKHV